MRCEELEGGVERRELRAAIAELATRSRIFTVFACRSRRAAFAAMVGPLDTPNYIRKALPPLPPLSPCSPPAPRAPCKQWQSSCPPS